jgi:hypothetical protein
MLRVELKIPTGRYVETVDVSLVTVDDRIEFRNSGFSKVLNNEIKSMKGWKWHGFDEKNPRKIWSVANHPRNVFQLKRLMGEDVYAWWEQELIDIEYERPLQAQQVDMIRRALTYHFIILAAEQGLGKSLAAIEIAERAGGDWWFCGPIPAQHSVSRELKKWDAKVKFNMMSYQKLVSTMRLDADNIIVPKGIIFDESSSLKTFNAQCSEHSQQIADMIRETHGFEGYVVLLSGTPTAKHPTDVWSQAEIAWPGFLREGSFQAFERRYAHMESMDNKQGVTFQKNNGWKIEEVAKLPARLKGLMPVYRKKDWLNLPDKKFIVEKFEPSEKIKRVARGLVHVAPNVITALTWCRALSSGFQYTTTKVGTKECAVCGGKGEYQFPEVDVCPGCHGLGEVPQYARKIITCATPKDDALRNWLDKCEAHGRIVISASFQGSIDRILKICKERGWACVAVDGRGWRYYDLMGKQSKDIEPLDAWEDCKHKVAFVGNPGSCRFGLTLTAANTLIFFDNNFSAEHRLQMQDRIHRIGMDEVQGARIVDFVHLPIDQVILDTLNENKRLEGLSLGVLNEAMGQGDADLIDAALAECNESE